MELLPIIYISLAVFSVIAVIIIIVSYISFKVRQRYGDGDEEEIVVNLKPTTISPTKKAIVQKKKARKQKESIRRKSRDKLKKEKMDLQLKTLKKPTKGRIEILNPIIDSPTSLHAKKHKTISDKSNILKHYSDDDNDDFFTIKGTKTD